MRILRAILLTISFLAFSASVFAQQQTEAAAREGSSPNMLAILMVIIALVLAFVIYVMGQVLLTLIRQLFQKNHMQNKVLAMLLLVLAGMISLPAHAQQAMTEPLVKVLPNYGGLTATSFWILVASIAIELVAILCMLFFITRIRQELSPAKARAASFDLGAWWTKVDKKLFTKAVPIEREEDIMLDHDYDGIRELDNSLPPWWKYGFAITVGIAVIYMLHFHVLGSGKNPTEEYAAELEQAKIQLEAYEAKNKDKVDENNVQLADASGLAAGQEIYEQMCWACHGKMGEGGAGPNLTDDYWLHKGSMNDIYKSIKSGYPDKGMQSWEKQYSAKQIAELAGYIRSLKGTNPANAKAAQGDLYVQGEVTTDTTALATAKN